nr:hypothetical protein [Proteus mirabilis]
MKLPYAIKQKDGNKLYEYPYNFFLLFIPKDSNHNETSGITTGLLVHVDDDIDHTTWQWHHKLQPA